MLLATVNQGGAEFTHGRSDAQNFTLCLGDISDDQYIDSLEAVTLTDGSTAYIQRNAQDTKAVTALDGSVLEGQVFQLDDGATAYIQHVHNGEEPSGVSGAATSESLRLEAGQAVQLEDGSTAYLHHIPKELYDSPALQAVQLEDGSTAFIQQALQMSTPDTILAIQESDSVSDLPLEEITDPETVTVLEQYAAKIEEMEFYTNTGLLTNENVVQIVFPSQDGRRSVQKLEEKSFQCGYEGCGKLYTTAYHLKVHARVHTGDKPYCCDKPGCDKKFATGHGLKNHMRTHTGEKPYGCTEASCKKSFKNSGDLQKHIRIHTGEKPFLCPYEGCGRSFRTSNICKVHMRTHTGEKPYHCSEPGCNRAFASATNYKNHSRIHTGERPYVCTIPGCDKRFTEYSSLYKHQVVHTPCKPYECSHCGKTYKQISTLALHKRTVHNESETLICLLVLCISLICLCIHYDRRKIKNASIEEPLYHEPMSFQQDAVTPAVEPLLVVYQDFRKPKEPTSFQQEAVTPAVEPLLVVYQDFIKPEDSHQSEDFGYSTIPDVLEKIQPSQSSSSKLPKT